MTNAVAHLLVACASLLLLTTQQAVRGGLDVEPEDIYKTIKSKNGVVVDCVYIHKQPTLKHHPLFKDHKIQVYPRSVDSRRPVGHLRQEWHSSGSCPAGTVPIRRLPKTTVTSPPAAMPSFSRDQHRRDAIILDDSNSPRQEFAIALALAGPYHGASALLPSWRLAKIEPGDASATSLVISGTVNRTWASNPFPGEIPPDVTNQIAVGLMTDPAVFGNGDPHLYVFYTNDGGSSRNCLNFQCPGFVQTSNEILLGASFIDGGSSIAYGGVPYVAVNIHRPSGQQQWWVSVNDTAVGYFPHFLFPTFFPESFVNQLGGSVRDTRPGGAHTDTEMGNGRTPDTGGAAVVKAYLAVAANGADVKDMPVKYAVTAPKCYNVAVLGENTDVPGYDIAYGGPGGSGCDE
ncbi:unnamed protein product [Urochloa decumbens]|uniref:Neprosin PEP catalytic domain-containing protein n=1 Tax=Urochloa decumbens TaxID=240449 RepID=A0ABC9FW35_9POAL